MLQNLPALFNQMICHIIWLFKTHNKFFLSVVTRTPYIIGTALTSITGESVEYQIHYLIDDTILHYLWERLRVMSYTQGVAFDWNGYMPDGILDLILTTVLTSFDQLLNCIGWSKIFKRHSTQGDPKHVNNILFTAPTV